MLDTIRGKAKMTKRFWMLFASLLLVLGVVAGCASDEGNEKEPDKEKPKDEESSADGETAATPFVLGDEQLDITMFGNYDWYTMPPWGDDISTAWIKENKKVNITAIDGGGNAAQRLSTLIAGKNLPDFIWTDKGADVEKLRQGGVLVPLDDYLDKYTNLRDWFGEEGINMLRSEDGKLYQFPNWYNSKPFGNAGYVVHKGIYEELGSPKLETTDDLYAYLKLVKEKFPEVTPFETHIEGQGIQVLYSAFKEGHTPGDIRRSAVAEGDKLTSIFEDAEYLESLQFASKLFREKLITQDALTQDMDILTAKVTGGKVAVYASASPTELSAQGHENMIKEDPDSGYFYIWPIAKEGLDKNNIFPGDFSMMGWNVSVITKDAKDPEKTFAFLDWLTGPEGQSSLIFGPEGQYWDGFDADGMPQFTGDYVSDVAGVIKVDTDTANFQWNGNSNFLDTAKAKFTASLPLEDRRWDTHWQTEVTWKTQLNATEFENINPLPDSDEGMILQSIGDIAEEMRAQTLYAKSDEEVAKIVAAAAENANKLGHEKLLKFQTEKWQANLAKMSGQ